MYQHFAASLIRKILIFFFVFLVAMLLVGVALGVIPLLIARAAVFDVGCNVPDLIQAITDANSNAEADSINLTLGCTYTLTATNNTTDGPSGLPSITSQITINGNGATIQRDLSFTCPDVSNPEFRIFHVASGGDLTLNDVTVSNGCVWNDLSGGGVYNKGTLSVSDSTISSNTCNQRGGGIFSQGTLSISDSNLSDNTATYGGGGIGRDDGPLNINHSTLSGNTATYGGAFYNSAGTATVVISNSVVYSNTAETYGGGILNNVKLNIGNSTFYGNTADDGGAIYNQLSTATVDISNSTLSDNTATWFYGGGIYNQLGTVNVKNSILANNTAWVGYECYGTINSQDYNLIENLPDDCTVTGSVSHNITGLDPSLGPLQDNGGPTWTKSLLGDSPAINHIPYLTSGCGTDYTTDQRGYIRPHPGEGNCDIGAYEYDSTPPNTPTPTPTETDTPTITPTPTPTITPTPTDTPTPTPTNTPIAVTCDVAELVSAITDANGSGGLDNINLEASCTYTLTVENNDTDGPNGLPSINSQIIIHGNGATIVRSSGNAFRIFHVASGGDLALNDITITNGDAGSGNHGGGVYNKGLLYIINSTVYSNTATSSYGGGIMDISGTVNIINSTFSGNSGDYGGGICSSGTLTIDNSTFSGNTATSSGGGIYSFSGTVNVRNTILAGNTGGDCSGTITSGGYNLDSDGSCVTDGVNNDITTGTPGLSALLQDNGGPTWTHALLSGSPAIDHIPYTTNGCGDIYTTDQRGYDRPCPAEGGCDIGAHEGYALSGDLDSDCDVDIQDIMLVAGRWRCQAGDACYNGRYDLDEDGDIDVVDVMLVTVYWGDAC